MRSLITKVLPAIPIIIFFMALFIMGELMRQ